MCLVSRPNYITLNILSEQHSQNLQNYFLQFSRVENCKRLFCKKLYNVFCNIKSNKLELTLTFKSVFKQIVVPSIL